jgi:glycosyltransferase involved in cell wall biosynthesis
MRSYLGVKDKLVLGYSGSLSPWQKVDKIFDILTILRNKGLDSVLLLLTRDTEKARIMAEEKSCMAFTYIMSCDYEHLGDYIMCFDLGFLLRDRLLMNHVASPTKFSEYMLCGVPVLISPGIGDLDEIVTQKNVGVFVKNYLDDTAIVQAVDQFINSRFDRKIIAKFGMTVFARESYLPLYEKIYSEDSMIGFG